jgi:hypothetical protein
VKTNAAATSWRLTEAELSDISEMISVKANRSAAS